MKSGKAFSRFNPLRLRPIPLMVAAIGVSAAMQALAADPVTEAMTRAYAPYRVALFRTNSGAQAESQQAIADAQQALGQVVTRYGKQPAAPYDRDASFAASLAKVAAVYEKAAGETRANQLPHAHETLEEARDLLAELRRRNQVIVYSDHMNASHAQMELVLKEGPGLLSGSGMIDLAGKAGALDYLARHLQSEAPADLAADGEFKLAAAAVTKSVADLNTALQRQDAAAIKEALGKLKGPYSRMFLKFG